MTDDCRRDEEEELQSLAKLNELDTNDILCLSVQGLDKEKLMERPVREELVSTL